MYKMYTFSLIDRQRFLFYWNNGRYGFSTVLTEEIKQRTMLMDIYNPHTKEISVEGILEKEEQVIFVSSSDDSLLSWLQSPWAS